MRSLIVIILLLVSSCMYAQNQPTFEQAWKDAQNNDPNACLWVGYFYLQGEGVTCNYTEAIKWLKKAADNGNTNSYGWLGNCYFNLQNYQEAVLWFKKDVNINKNIYSYIPLGTCYGKQKNYSEAIYWYKKATDNVETQVQAYINLGMCYYAQQNYQEAINWFKKTIDNGDTEYCDWLGSCYYQQKKIEEAIEWLEKAIEKGKTYSYAQLGDCYLITGKLSEAESCFKNAIKNNSSINFYGRLGDCLFREEKYEEALLYLKKAIENGEVINYYQLSTIYYQGLGTKVNYQEAFKWAQKGTEEKNPFAIGLLSDMYFYGKGVAQNMDEAFKLLKQAAENGDYTRYTIIGDQYFIGEFVPKDYFQAFCWQKKAVEAGDLRAYIPLGYMYEHGLGTKQNIQEAIKLYSIAEEKGDTSAIIALFNVHYTNKKYFEAKSYAEKAIQKGLKNIGYRELALLCIYGLGVPKDKDKAFDLISKAIDAARQEGGPMPNNTLDVEGQLYLADNNISKAREIYKKILKETPDFYTQRDSKLSKFMKEHKGGDVDIDIPIVNNMSINTFAVIISNEKYQMEKSVQYAENDGKMFTEYCKKTLGLPEKNVHFITNATLNNIKHEIKWLQDVIAVYNGDAKVIFYYAGHGIPDEQNKSAYLLPIDGYGSDVTTGYALEDLYKALDCLPSKAVTIFLDACFSGAKRDGDMLASARGVAIKVKQNNPTGNMVVFTAAQGDETAYPYKDEGHGLFTYYLLKKLQETKGDVTLGELGDYIKTQVERQSIVTNGKLQSPAILSASSIGNSWKEWKLNK